ncbi:hypothetical protein H8356DRAFT_1700609 [Neocallimastix lanati (nom. inval.)]|jgi:hypothetical protein|uniref:GPI anchored serine-threonine rich protein n=1 Tax=Neocallimastix californiae TaxID=1754190 RepID=A0A1Y2C4H1_9FUNG|nr:hypothetical protein H8356DRAFT_1700609 [Neocallimastix sp. JGI-2020a]ORY41787.1 hypothetical protein LY90DRAFT_703926 [Neocallimastix californiae]|eukprot:ORY41787.1 hypothetical protein LY90DRAFT_703926 [Neocallimastix californiae]
MKSFLFALVILFVGFVYADCPEPTLVTMNDCVKIRTDARDSFCVTKQGEIAKCNCVYDSLIRDCYSYCPDEPTIQTAKQQLESELNAQCASANLDPKAIPANVYNEVTSGAAPTGDTYTANNQTGAVNNNNTPAANNNSAAANNNNNNLTSEDYAGSAESNKYFFSLIFVNAVLALVLLL